MLKDLGLDPARIPARGERLTVADIEAWLAARARDAPRAHRSPPAVAEKLPVGSGHAAGALARSRRHAAHGAVASRPRGGGLSRSWSTTPSPGRSTRRATPTQHKLMLSPLLPLMAFRLAVLGRERPTINATIVDDRRYQYRAGEPRIHGAGRRDALPHRRARCAATWMRRASSSALGEVQRHAMAHKLVRDEASGATLSFSSMARWNVSRHIPILPPQTSLIVAHAAPKSTGSAVLGASYDHRLLSGFDVAQVLQALSRPPA